MKKTLNLARSFRMYAVLVCMMILMALSMPERAEAATKKINVGSSVTFSVSGPAKWSLSNKKVAKIKAIGSRKAKVTGIKAGTTKVTARVGDKKYTINLTIKAAAKKKTKKSVSPKAANDNAAVQVNARSIPGSRDMVFTVDTGATVTGHFEDVIASEIAAQTSAYRTSSGAGALKVDKNLVTAARVRAYEAAVSWNHTRPNGKPYLHRQ